jgi:WD40 repeat protein
MSTRIEEVKQQLSSQSEQERLAALSETLNYGQQGLELLIEQSIKDQSDKVKQFAYRVFRGETSYLRGDTPEILTPSPTDIITSLAISPDNTILVGGSWKRIWLWNLESGEIIRSIEGHSHWVLSVAISPDGNKLVTGSADKTIKVWDLKTGQIIHTLNGHYSWITAVDIAADGKNIVSGSTDKTIKIWDLNTSKLNKTLQGSNELSSVLSLCISHDGKAIVCGSTNNKITLWDLYRGQFIRSIEGHSAGIQSLSITSDNTTLISGSRDGVVKFWQSSKPGEESSTQSGSVLGKGLVDVAATVAGFSLGGPIALGAWVVGRVIVGALDNKDLSKLPLQNLECTKTYPHNQLINSLVCHVNQNILVVGFSKHIKIFDLKDNRVIYTSPEQPSFISSVAVSPNGKNLVIAGKDWVTLLEAKTGKKLHAIKGCSYPKLSKIVILESSQELFYGQSKHFNVKGLDQQNREMNLNDKDIKWETSGGTIEQGLFTAYQREGRFEVKAKISFFEASVTITIIAPPTITEISVTPSRITLEFGKTQQFTAQVLDQRKNPMQETVLWEVNRGGTIDQNGNFLAGENRGDFEIIASVGSIRRVIPITIIEPPRLTELIVISSTSQLKFGQSFQFQVKGQDQYGNNIQTGAITWSVSNGGTIDLNGNFVAGENRGNFEIFASASSIRRVIPITIIEPPRLTELIITSSIEQLEFGQSFQFQVKGLDQYGDNINIGQVTWSTTGGSILNNGMFHASYQKEKITVTATVGEISISTDVSIVEPPKLTTLVISPKQVKIRPGQDQKFKLQGLDQWNNEIAFGPVVWQATGGTIEQNGNFIADINAKGNFRVTVTATEYNISAFTDITVVSVLRYLSIFPNEVTLKPEENFTFDVIGFDQEDEPIQVYQVDWQCSQGGKINGNGTFIGGYENREITVNATVESISQSAKVTLLPVLRRLEIYPQKVVTLKPDECQKFTAVGLDQYGNQIDTGKISWEATGGKIDQNGNFTADHNAKGTFKVRANVSEIAESGVRAKLLIWGIYMRLLYRVFSLINFTTGEQTEQAENTETDVVTNEETESLGFDMEGWLHKIIFKIFVWILDLVGQLFINTAKISASVEVIIIPVLRRLEISPKEAQLKPNQNLTFSAKGFDQQGALMRLENIIWRATSGNINSDGKFIAGQSIGQVTITANFGEICNSIFINVLADIVDPIPPDEFDLDEDEEEDDDIFIYNFIFLEYYLDLEIAYNSKPDSFEYKISNWFYRSQLFYDGYSINEMMDYNSYLSYVDSRTYLDYLMDE